MKEHNGVPRILPIILLLELVSLGATFPVIAYYVRDLGGSAFHVTFCFFLTAAPKVVLQPWWGGLSDRIGRKPVLIIALFGSLIAYIGWAIAPTLVAFLLARAFMGLFGSQLTLATSVVADRLPPSGRAQGLGLLGAIAGAGFVIGPLMGGMIGSATSLAAVGWVNAGLEGLALLLTFAFLPETAPPDRDSRRGNQNALKMWRRALTFPSTRILLLSVFATTLGASVLQGTIVVLAEDRWGFDVAQTGRALALFFLIGAAIQGGALRTLVPRFGQLNLARVGALLLAAGVALLAPDGPVSLLWIALTLAAIGSSLNTPTMTALLSNCTEAADQGKVLGLNQGITGLGRSFSGISMGGLYDRFGATMPFSLSALAALAGFLLLLPLGRKLHAPPVRLRDQ